MGGIYEVRRCDRLRCHNVHTKFHTDWFAYSKVYGGGGDAQTYTQHGDCISLLLFFENKKNSLTRNISIIISEEDIYLRTVKDWNILRLEVNLLRENYNTVMLNKTDEHRQG
jgi:hypothetical protein